MGCLNSHSVKETPFVHTDVIVENSPIDYHEILSKLNFRRKFAPISLDEVWPFNPLQQFIDNHSLLTFFHFPSVRRGPTTKVAKCYNPDLHCTSTNIFLCPYRWKLNEPFKGEFLYEPPHEEFSELRTLIADWHEQGYSLRVLKKMPGSDKVRELFDQDGHVHCILQCIFQNCDLGIGYKILGMPWTHRIGKNGYLDYDFPDIASELSRLGRQGYRICGIFGTLVSLPQDHKVGSICRNRLHFILEQMPDRVYRFKQSVFTYHKKSTGGRVEVIGDIEDWIYSFTSRGWVLGATMKMPYQPDHLGSKIPELLVFQTHSENVI